MGDARKASNVIPGDMFGKLSNPLSATGTAQTAVIENSHTTRIVSTVFQALEAFHQNRGNVTGCNCTDDATHKRSPSWKEYCAPTDKKYYF
jgi:hypothetical protein